MERVQAVKKLNSILRERLNFQRQPILCTTLYRNPILYKRATLVAHLTNFSLEFFMQFFTQDAPPLFLHHGAKKSKMTKNSNQGGGGPDEAFPFSLLMAEKKQWWWDNLDKHAKTSSKLAEENETGTHGKMATQRASVGRPLPLRGQTRNKLMNSRLGHTIADHSFQTERKGATRCSLTLLKTRLPNHCQRKQFCASKKFEKKKQHKIPEAPKNQSVRKETFLKEQKQLWSSWTHDIWSHK